ncbi:hypothetical protein PTSG_05071 [Salpingoeca rosetta]|uniref:Metallo-beta-lactamase domain-containing protein n=1 Tax=Salpingoeca rosetta (strain ATCC 50818 / BSB-021) TaxID=946362 RepID=F2U9F7_SALR5|nr:uncharacterized protein PTSG_05071 [Salpingoeca rosetta]EGD73360.1 hypothetical protein PTSG_05071 [Salpingoeca rosetta]|eukprot:XP_004994390.1 hypothetical protein PTSG_05071 [Salpingoeca rosetta]
MTEVLDGLEITSHSSAGHGTCITVTTSNPLPRLSICFDIGACLTESVQAQHVFVSHCHTDHVGSLMLHARAREMCSGPATYYVPEPVIPHLRRMQQLFADLDSDGVPKVPPARFEPIWPGRVVPVGKGFAVKVLAVEHRVHNAFAFVLQRRDRLPLPPEFRGLPPMEIKALYDENVVQKFGPPKALLTYSGDCVLRSLLKHAFVLSTRVLICELTYLDDRTESKAEKYMHVHLKELVPALHRFRNLSHLHLVHFSTRYCAESICGHLMALPTRMQDRTSVGLMAFGESSAALRWALKRVFYVQGPGGCAIPAVVTSTRHDHTLRALCRTLVVRDMEDQPGDCAGVSCVISVPTLNRSTAMHIYSLGDAGKATVDGIVSGVREAGGGAPARAHGIAKGALKYVLDIERGADAHAHADEVVATLRSGEPLVALLAAQTAPHHQPPPHLPTKRTTTPEGPAGGHAQLSHHHSKQSKQSTPSNHTRPPPG